MIVSTSSRSQADWSLVVTGAYVLWSEECKPVGQEPL